MYIRSVNILYHTLHVPRSLRVRKYNKNTIGVDLIWFLHTAAHGMCSFQHMTAGHCKVGYLTLELEVYCLLPAIFKVDPLT